MSKNLEVYLREIDHHLPFKGSNSEILSEIESHILEKVEHEFGEINEDSIKEIISRYGNPKEIAEKYMEGYQIISPAFKKHLFLYTGILFAFHLGFTLLSLIFRTSMMGFPFLYVPRLDAVEALFYIPMAFVFDFGLVAMFLHVVSQKRGRIRLPWPRLEMKDRTFSAPKKPNLVAMALMLTGLALIIFIFVKFKTLFFVSLNTKNPESLLNPEASIFYSLVFIGMYAVSAIGYAYRFFNNSEVVRLVKDGFILILFWIAWNNPVEDIFKDTPGLGLKGIATLLLTIFTVLAVMSFIENLIKVNRKSFSLKI